MYMDVACYFAREDPKHPSSFPTDAFDFSTYQGRQASTKYFRCPDYRIKSPHFAPPL